MISTPIISFFRYVNDTPYRVTAALFNISYDAAVACFEDLSIFEVMKVGYTEQVQYGNITDLRGYCWCVVPGMDISPIVKEDDK